MTEIAIIGGTGLSKIKSLTKTRKEVCVSEYGEPSAPLTYGKLFENEVVFLPRHGASHTIPPHKINYRANIDVLHHVGVKYILAINAVGGITSNMSNQALVIPDQIIDYTYSRKHTYYENGLEEVTHVDFTSPYCEELRGKIINSANSNNINIIDSATYAATQGPRLESSAEIDRLERDGCHIVGMTGMPEASLAREKNLCYASIAVVANMAAGRGDGEITMQEIEKNIDSGMNKLKTIIESIVSDL